MVSNMSGMGSLRRSCLLAMAIAVVGFLAGCAMGVDDTTPEPSAPQAQEGVTRTPEADNAVVLCIPIIEYEGDNVLSTPIVKEYERELIRPGDVFVIEPVTLGYEMGNAVGAIKLSLVDTMADGVVVDVVADVRHDGSFHARDGAERHEIRDGSCIGAYPLVVDATFRYCFDVQESGSRIELRYRLERESTLPSP